MKPISRTLICGLGLAVLTCQFALAQSATVKKNPKWEQDFTLYFIGAGMSGTTGMGDLEADIDVSFSDLVSNLKFGMMANYRAVKGPFTVGADLIYMDLGADLPRGGEVDFEQWMVEGNVGWKLTDFVEVLAGVRFNDLSGSMTVVDPVRMGSGSEYWFDPIVGARFWIPITDSFFAAFRTDIGGFGVGSDLTYQLAGYLVYKTSGSLSFIGGWRYFNIDYENGSGSDYFLYDMEIQGPALGLSWAF
jgi:hypothetical protein